MTQTKQSVDEIMEEFKRKFGAFAIMGSMGRIYNGAFANEARIGEAQDWLKQKLNQVREDGIKIAISQFLQMNIENPNKPVNINEVKRRAIKSLKEQESNE